MFSQGLGRINVEGDNDYIVYATKHDEVALDGVSGEQNSPFVMAMVDRIRQDNPPLELDMLFRHVRDDVKRKTNHRQQPWTYGSLGVNHFYF